MPPTASAFQAGVRLKDEINAANPNRMNDALRDAKLGEVLRQQIVHTRFNELPALQSYNLSTLHIITLPDDAKALHVLRAFARTGTTTGDLAPQTSGATPATGQIAVTPSGDIAVLAADVITNMDVSYIPVCGDVFEFTLPCVASVATLPAKYTASPRGGILLCEAEALTGTVTGKKIILAPAASAPATLNAKLNIARTTVTFNNATDAVLTCRVKVIVVPEVVFDVNLRAAPFGRELTGPSGNLK